MFLNQRSRRIAALVVTVFLLAVRPAAAGGHTPVRASSGYAAGWQDLVARVLAWLSAPWDGGAAVAGIDSSANIDPLGQH